MPGKNRVSDDQVKEETTPLAASPSSQKNTTTTEGEDVCEGFRRVDLDATSPSMRETGLPTPLEVMCTERIVLAPVDDSDHSGATDPLRFHRDTTFQAHSRHTH